ncbi:MAG: tetratricopeptide repeat protein, partial [Planctomycetes bacterium]|nr:tetratricopeptide repeat protein [Planctomycetota bacterium]
IPRLRAVLPALAGQREAPRALLALGRALRRSGDPAGSRVVLRDLLALELPADDPIAGDAAYEIALSHGAPTPVPGELDRAIAALRALQQQHPGHPKARTAEFAIARCQAHCGRTSDALAALARFLAAAGDSGLPEVADARAMVGDVLFGQSELERAIAAYGDYLRLHPAHSEWERVQRAIVDAEYGMAVADQQRGASGFESARTRFEAFVQKHPLDARNPEIHARLGDMLVEEERYDEARAAYARCVAKYPGKPASSRAQFAIGRLHETRKFDYEAALAAYRAVEGPLAPQARAAIAQLTRKSLELQTAHVFRTDEQPVFAIRSRNIEQVRVRIYRLGLEDYFRATHTIAGVDRLDIEIIAPDRTFESAVEGYRRHQETERDVAIGFTEPGAYVVKVDDRELEATTMVLVSDLALISKSNRHEFFVFTQDTRRGEPAGGVRVVLSDGEKVLAEGATGPDGVYRFAGDALQARDRLVVFAVAPSGSGASSLPLSGLGFSPGLQPKGYLYTDRPLYGPGQTVQLKGILREIANGLYRVPAGAGYRLHVSRPNGRPLRTEALELSAFGTFASALELPVDAELGTWTIAVSRPDGPDFRGTFEVGKYERPRLAVALELEEPVVFRGERIQGRAVLRHFYGEPAVGKPVVLTLRLPD